MQGPEHGAWDGANVLKTHSACCDGPKAKVCTSNDGMVKETTNGSFGERCGAYVSKGIKCLDHDIM